MAPDRATALFFELFRGLPRQGPGSTASTLRALRLVPGVGPRTRVLDIGCGTGAQTLVLAHGSRSRIVAVDNHPPFVDALNREARRLGITERLEARVADMRSLDFADGSFDLIWCEGAIYNVGVEAGLRDWRRLLRPEGHVALTEVCWRKPEPAAAGQPERVPNASSRRAGRPGAGGPVPAGDRHLARILGVLRLRVPRAARPLKPASAGALRRRRSAGGPRRPRGSSIPAREAPGHEARAPARALETREAARRPSAREMKWPASTRRSRSTPVSTPHPCSMYRTSSVATLPVAPRA